MSRRPKKPRGVFVTVIEIEQALYASYRLTRQSIAMSNWLAALLESVGLRAPQTRERDAS